MVRKLFRLLFLLSLLLVTAGFYAWHRVGELMDTVQEQLPKGWMLSYQHHYIDHQGLLTLTNARLSSDLYGTLFTADKITYKPKHWMEFWSLRENLLLGEYPEYGEFRIEDLTIPVRELAKTNKSTSDLRVIQLLAQGCGEKSSFSLADLVDAGMTQLNGFIELDYFYNPLGSNIKFKSSVHLEHFSGLEWQLELNDFAPGTDRTPYLVFAQWVLFEPHLIVHRNRYCSSLNQQTQKEFAEQHSSRLFQFFEEQGLILSDNFQTRYQLFTEKPENISVTLSPQTGIPLPKLQTIEYADWIDQLGIKLIINGRAVEKVAEQPRGEPTPVKVEDTTPSETLNRIIQSPSLEQLQSRIGRKVEIIDVRDRRFEGEIIAATQNSVKLKVRVSGGFATLNIKPEKIHSLTELN
jgi:hypothetical protein